MLFINTFNYFSKFYDKLENVLEKVSNKNDNKIPLDENKKL